MTQSAALFSLSRPLEQRQAIQTYLDDLPVLDRKVLYYKYAEKKDPREISHDLRISPLHVERILSRAQTFAGECHTNQRPVLEPWPVRTRSPLAAS